MVVRFIGACRLSICNAEGHGVGCQGPPSALVLKEWARAARPPRYGVLIMMPVFLSLLYCGLIFISGNFENVNCFLGSFLRADVLLRFLAHGPLPFYTPTNARTLSLTDALISTHTYTNGQTHNIQTNT